MSAPPDLTVVVPAHGTACQLAPLLGALSAQALALLDGGATLRVVVADDFSSPPLSDGLAAGEGVDLVVARRDSNGGPGAARNRGLEEVATTWVAFLDADVVPADGWLAHAVHLIAQPDAPDLIEGRARIPAEPRPTPFTHATEIAPPDQRGAGNVIFRTAVLRDLGGFDERFFDPVRKIHFREDTELAFRLEEAGRPVAYAPELIVDHPPLAPAFWGPVRLSRRYRFDPLLSREHPAAFKAMNAHRKVGLISLRRARHDSSALFAAGVVVLGVGLVAGSMLVAAAGGMAALAGWAATAFALAWRRQVRPRDVVPLLAVSLVVPWVYLGSWWRGVVQFRHRPRL
jgi:glycosyltransferase involved in cell wall biosynthesis